MKRLTVKIGTSSLPNVYPIFEATKKIDSDKYGLVLKEMQTGNGISVIEEINRAYQWAIEKEVEIWTLPELCFPEKYLNELIKLLDKNSGKLKLVVAGSQNIKSYLSYKNRLNLYEKSSKTGRWGVALCTYDKKIPFSCGLSSKEGLTPSDKNIFEISKKAKEAGCKTLIEDIDATTSNPILSLTVDSGDTIKIGFGICLDVLNLLDNRNPLHNYITTSNKADLMLITSMNSGFTNLFTGGAECMARWYDCATVYVNNMTSVSDGSVSAQKAIEMSYAILPHPDKPGGVRGKVYYKDPPVFKNRSSEENAEFYNNVSVIFSNGVTAERIDETGNVLYDINEGKLS